MAEEEEKATSLENALEAYLGPILAKLPDNDGLKIAAMIKYELEHRALVTFCNSVTGYDWEARAEVWSDWIILERSPIDPDKTIIAMVQCEREVVVFTVVEVEAADDPGEIGYAFHREVIFEPKQIAGPLHHKALVRTFERFMMEAEPEPVCPICNTACIACGTDAQPNGRAHANGAPAGKDA